MHETHPLQRRLDPGFPGGGGSIRVRGFATEQVSLEERFVALTGEGFDVVQ